MNKAFHSFTKGPAGSGWELSIQDDEGSGIGVSLNYHKVGWPNQTLFKEELGVRDLIRIKQFCEHALNALATPSFTEGDD